MIGYARVSTSGQTLAVQIEQLKAAGCTVIFQETASGARTERPQLIKAIAALPHDSVLMVTRLDRLARSTRDLLNIVAQIEARGARFKSLAETWADTTTPAGRLMLTVLGGLAEFERSLIAERTGEGRARAVKAGKRLGRRPLLTGVQRAEALRMAHEEKSHAEIGQLLRVSRSTVTRFLARARAC
jgi:DNA invertase Pin-like site-specific DNA recombinase